MADLVKTRKLALPELYREKIQNVNTGKQKAGRLQSP